MATGISSETRDKVRQAWPVILNAIAAGALIRDTIAQHGISRQVISTYVLTEPGAKVQWDEAREASADALYDEAVEVARDPWEMTQPTDNSPAVKVRRDPQASRLLVDTLKWAARIRNPRLYGDKAQLDVNVKTVDLTRIISDANARLIAAQSMGRIIDATPSNSGDEGVNAHAQLTHIERATVELW